MEQLPLGLEIIHTFKHYMTLSDSEMTKNEEKVSKNATLM